MKVTVDERDGARCVAVRSCATRTVEFFESLPEPEAGAAGALAASMLDALADGLAACARARREEDPDRTGPILAALRDLERGRREDSERLLRVVEASGERGADEMVRRLADSGRLRDELQLRVVEPVAAGVRARVEELAARLSGEATQHVPVYVARALSSALGDIRERGAVAQAQLSRLEAQSQESARRLQAVEKGGDGVSGKVDAVAQQLAAMQARQAGHSRSKGAGGEARLLEALSAELPVREGYSVEAVGGMAHCCDMVVRRPGRPEVRIESKLYADRVGSKEVQKFRSDLIGLDVHGVFVSLQSGIVGMGEVEIEQLPTGRFAVYLANNGYNAALVRDMIALVYKLDRYAGAGSEADDAQAAAVRVPTEVMKQVREHLRDTAHKVGRMRVHLRESMQLLNQMALDQLERLLLAGGDPATPPPSVSVSGAPPDAPRRIRCPSSGCSKTYAPGSAGCLARHLAAAHGEQEAAAHDAAWRACGRP